MLYSDEFFEYALECKSRHLNWSRHDDQNSESGIDGLSID